MFFKKNKNGKFREYKLSEMHILEADKDSAYWKAICSDGNHLQSSFTMFDSEHRNRLPSYFIIDQDDSDWISTKEDAFEYLKNLDCLTKHRPDKKIYVRYQPAAKGSKKSKRLIVLNDFLTAIPTLFRQQKIAFEDHLDALVKLRSILHKYHVIFLEQGDFEFILDSLSISRSLITLVPDVTYEITRKWALKWCESPVTFYDADGSTKISPGQAMLLVFQSQVCGLNWNRSMCPNNHSCLVSHNKSILGTLGKYALMDENEFQFDQCVTFQNEKFRNDCASIHQWNQADHELESHRPEDAITWDSYFNTCKSFGIPNFEYFLERKVGFNKKMRVWMARVLYIAGWMCAFFPPHNELIKERIGRALLLKVPDEMKSSFWKLLKEIIHDKKPYEVSGRKAEHLETTPSPLSNEVYEKRNLILSQERAVKMHRIVGISVNSHKHCQYLNREFLRRQSCAEQMPVQPEKRRLKGVETMGMVEESKPTPEPMEPQEAPLRPQEEQVVATAPPRSAPPPHDSPAPSEQNTQKSKLCDKCTRNGQALLKVQGELKAAENKAKKYEEKAKITIETEKKMKKLRKEMEELKRDNEGMNKRNGKLDGQLEKEREEKTKVEEENMKLKEQVAREQQENVNARQEIAFLRQRDEQLELKIALKQSRMEAELKKKDELIARLQNRRAQRSSTPPPLSISYGPTRDLPPSMGASIFGASGGPSTPSSPPPQEETEVDSVKSCYICFDDFEEGQKVVICKGCRKPIHEKCGYDWKKAQKELNPNEGELCGHCRRKMTLKDENKKTRDA